MKNKMDRFLLAVLWLLVVTLGTCFWFNVRYGFNLFLASHWKYLATLQAGQVAIQPGFYLSLIICTIVGLVGLYILVRPKFRRIKIAKPAPTQPSPTPAPEPEQPSGSKVFIPDSTFRPMRPNVARPTSFDAVPPPNGSQSTPSAASTAPTPTVNQAQTADYPEIREIFESTGYVVKKTPSRIDGTPIVLLAIGDGEQLWLGGVGLKIDDMTRAIDKLNQVFSDTLDDIFININAFIVASPDGLNNTSEILTFDGMSELSTYMNEHRNPTLSDDEKENFDAYSEYIDTVIEYIGKI